MEQNAVLCIIDHCTSIVLKACHTEVILARLYIAHLHAIYVDRSMSASHSPEAHGLEAGIATIVTKMQRRIGIDYI